VSGPGLSTMGCELKLNCTSEPVIDIFTPNSANGRLQSPPGQCARKSPQAAKGRPLPFSIRLRSANS
jgi:hypothetical protein